MATAAVPQLFQGVDKASFGYKLLANLGWKEGEGLGAQRQGITEHVKVKKKYDAYGVGAVEHASKVRDWTTGLVGYDTILSNLKEISNKPSKAPATSSSSSSSSDEDSDTDARPTSNKKRKRTSSSAKRKTTKQIKTTTSSSSSEDGSSSGSDSDDEGQAGPGPSSSAAAAAAAEVARVKAATHLGRYSKRERAKAVSHYSATDLAAILGGTWSAPPEIKAATTRGGSTTTTSSSSSDGGSDNSSGSSSSDDEQGGDSAQALQPSTPPPCESSPVAAAGGSAKAAASSPQQPQQQQAAAEEEVGPPRWWSNMFAPAADGAGVGAGSSGRRRIQVAGFSEQDQTDLYMQVHDAKTSGRVGLGRSSMPKKVAGARWQGKKTILADSDAEEEQDAPEQQQQQGVEDTGMEVDTSKYVVSVKNGITIVMPRSKLGQGAAAGGSRAHDTQQQEKQGVGQPKGKGKKCKQQQEQQQVLVKAVKGSAGRSTSKAAAASQLKGTPATTTAAAAAAGGSGSKGTEQDKKVKWGKLAQRILANAPKRRMKLEKLRQQVLEAAGLAGTAAGSGAGTAGGCGGEGAQQQMVKKLRKSSSFVVGEKYVSLADAA